MESVKSYSSLFILGPVGLFGSGRILGSQAWVKCKKPDRNLEIATSVELQVCEVLSSYIYSLIGMHKMGIMAEIT